MNFKAAQTGKWRYMGDRPKVGIRPTIDGRLGGVRESLEDRTMGMAKSAAELISANLKYVDGTAVEGLVESMQDKGNRALFITDSKEEHGGLDFYLSDKGSALTITKKVQGKYGGSIKQSSKNIGMKDSRQVYRMTYLLRLPSFRKGDFISYSYTSDLRI